VYVVDNFQYNHHEDRHVYNCSLYLPLVAFKKHFFLTISSAAMSTRVHYETPTNTNLDNAIFLVMKSILKKSYKTNNMFMHIDRFLGVQILTYFTCMIFLIIVLILIGIEACSTFSWDCSTQYFQSIYVSYLLFKLLKHFWKSMRRPRMFFFFLIMSYSLGLYITFLCEAQWIAYHHSESN